MYCITTFQHGTKLSVEWCKIFDISARIFLIVSLFTCTGKELSETYFGTNTDSHFYLRWGNLSRTRLKKPTNNDADHLVTHVCYVNYVELTSFVLCMQAKNIHLPLEFKNSYRREGKEFIQRTLGTTYIDQKGKIFLTVCGVFLASPWSVATQRMGELGNRLLCLWSRLCLCLCFCLAVGFLCCLFIGAATTWGCVHKGAGEDILAEI